MYLTYWQLSEKPFDAALDARFYYRSEVHQGALLKLRYGIEKGPGATLLAGGAGFGKTLLVELLKKQPSDTLGPIVQVVFPQLPTDQLLAFLADEFDGNRTGSWQQGVPPMQDSLRRLQTTLTENATRGRQALLVIDEAHLIEDPRTWETLRLLLNFQHEGRPLLSLLLVGQPALLPLLDRLPGLEQRISVKCLLRPLTDDETASYVTHRLKEAGAEQTIFDSSALEAIHVLTQGCPRRINRLCDLALLIAFAEEHSLITASHVEAVSQELLTVTTE